MVRLGPYTLRNPWILAPMAGVSEMPFRRIALEMGAAAAPTELVSAKGLLFGQERTRRYLRHHPDEQPFWVQLFGGEPEVMADGAERAVELGAKIIDINMGCPVRKITRRGAGSALLADPERAATIISAVAGRAGVPVTVKIRSGWDAQSIRPEVLAKMFADAGAVAIAMHARTREQGYSGRADWELIARLVERSPIPVIGNGDALTAQRARDMLAETGCAAVMIGRGALGNPWIFAELTGALESAAVTNRWPTIQRHLDDHLEHVGDERVGLHKFRGHLGWYAHGLEGAAKFRERVMTITELGELVDVCASFFGQARRARQEAAPSFDAMSALG